jgi:hypothetical protein
MSIFSKIGRGIKKLKFKNVLAVGAGVAALALPGVGGAVVAGVKGAGSLIGRSGAAAGKIVKATGGAVSTAASGIAGGATDAASAAGDTLDAVTRARAKVEDATKRVGAAAGKFQADEKTAATQGAVAGFLSAIPPVAWIGVAALVVLLFLRGKRK